MTQERAASHESPGVLQQRVGGAAGGGAAVDVASASASSLVTTRPGKFLVPLRVSGGSDSERTSGARHPGLVLQCLALQHKSPPGLGPSPEAEQSASGGSGSVSGSADARGAASLIPPAPLPAGNVPAGRRGPPGDDDASGGEGDGGGGGEFGGGGGGGGDDPDDVGPGNDQAEEVWPGGRPRKGVRLTLPEEAWEGLLAALRSSQYQSYVDVAKGLKSSCPSIQSHYVKKCWSAASEAYKRYAARRFQSLSQSLLAAGVAQRAEPVAGLFFEMWDETKAQVLVRARSDEPYYHLPTQLMVAMMGYALVAVLGPRGGARPRELGVILGDLPTETIPVGFQTGELFSHATGAVSAPYREALAPWPNKTNTSLTDRAGANEKKVRGEEAENFRDVADPRQREPALHTGCKAHDQHHCNGESFTTCPRCIPKTAKCLSSVSFSGTASGLRRAIGETLVSFPATTHGAVDL